MNHIQLGSLDVGPGKPEHIFAQTGRLPVFAGGNADVDIEMLESARFALLVNHDDRDREFAYTAGGEASLAKAAELGGTIVRPPSDTPFGRMAPIVGAQGETFSLIQAPQQND